MNARLCEQAPVYLTFDDGPDPDYTPRLLDILDLFGIKATFFVLGEACRRYPELLRRALAAGHAIGNHTVHHRHPWLISRDHARAEVSDAFKLIADIGGEAPRLFRPPYGRRRRCMLDEAESLGMETLFWDRSAIDWGWLANEDGISARLGKVQPGQILLCHDAPRSVNRPDLTLSVLPAFIGDCRERQLSFATLHQRSPSGAPRSLSKVQSV